MICNECSCVNWHNESCSQYEPTELEQVTAERDRLRELLERAVDHVGFYDPDTPTGDLVLEIERALEGGEG